MEGAHRNLAKPIPRLLIPEFTDYSRPPGGQIAGKWGAAGVDDDRSAGCGDGFRSGEVVARRGSWQSVSVTVLPGLGDPGRRGCAPSLSSRDVCMRSRPLAIVATHVPLPSTPQVADTHTLPMNIWIEPRNVGGRVLLGPPVVIRYRRETIRVPVSSLGANITANVSRCPCYYVLHFVSRWEGSDSERCDRPVWIILFLFAREVCDESWW